jgi:ketosteroid isomerase-like protein
MKTGDPVIIRNAMRRIAMFFVIFCIAISGFSCHKETEEDKVGKVIADIQAAAEQKDIRRIMDSISDTYSDPRGFNREGIRRLLAGYFFRYPKISVYVNDLTISVFDTSARALFQTVLTHGEKTGSVTDVIPQSLGVWNFEVVLKKEANDWKVTSAGWKPSEMMKTAE